MLSNQPELSTQLRNAIGATPIHVIATESGVSPSTINKVLNAKMQPRHSRVIEGIKKILKRNE